jgi:hypothetical protein
MRIRKYARGGRRLATVAMLGMSWNGAGLVHRMGRVEAPGFLAHALW